MEISSLQQEQEQSSSEATAAANGRTCSPQQPKPDNTSSITSSSIRFLITNSAAGSVIGKGGATISEFQTQSGARIQLSRNHEYFPGTADRIILINGTVSEILTALHLIFSKITIDEQSNEDENDGDYKANKSVRLIVPNNVCGAIIGKGGSTIKAFVETTGAQIKLSSQDQTIRAVNDRLITITGTLEQLLRAVDSIFSKLSEDPNYAQFASTPISYPSQGLLDMQGIRGRFIATPTGYGAVPYFSKGFMAPPLVHITLPIVGAGPLTTSLTLAVPDGLIGGIVGRGGKTITEIEQASGVKIRISDRGDFVCGTTHRKVTISGNADGVRIAQHLLTQQCTAMHGIRLRETQPCG